MEKGSWRLASTPEERAKIKKRWARRFRFLAIGVGSILCLALLAGGAWYGMGYGVGSDEREAFDAAFEQNNLGPHSYVFEAGIGGGAIGNLEDVAPRLASADRRAVEAFLSSVKKDRCLRPFRSKHAFRWLPAPLIDYVIDESDDRPDVWKRFFGDAEGVVSAVPPLRLPSGKILVSYDIYGGRLYGTGSVAECEKVGGVWRVVEIYHSES